MAEDGKTPVFLSGRARLGAAARRYLASPEDVEDALQELFVRTWQQGRQGATAEQRRAFLFRTLRNICVDVLRRRRPVAGTPEDSREAMEREHTEENPVESDDLTEAVRLRARKSLSGAVLKVFELYTFGELDYAEIAERLGMPQETVRSYMCRARKVMRQQCEELLKK